MYYLALLNILRLKLMSNEHLVYLLNLAIFALKNPSVDYSYLFREYINIAKIAADTNLALSVIKTYLSAYTFTIMDEVSDQYKFSDQWIQPQRLVRISKIKYFAL